MRLLPLDRFAHVFEPLCSRGRIGIVDGFGNPGDKLLDAAARQLLQAFGLSWTTINPIADPPNCCDVDVILLAAGGSMGGPRECIIHRQRGLAWGKPCIVLPQSFHAPEDCSRYETVYVREKASLEMHPSGIYAPDIALGYDWPTVGKPHLGKAVFCRNGGHSLFAHLGTKDPATYCYDHRDYIAEVSKHSHIVTDRLHLAITALGLGRRATLLPVSYHKNRSMWECWLRDLGCEWADEP